MSDKPVDRGRGRPREFDENEALERIMKVFWSRGYDGTSLDELLAETGVARQSLYRIFGNKRDVFLRALRHYGELVAAHLRQLLDENPSALTGLRQLIDLWEQSAAAADYTGCLNLNSISEFAGRKDSEVEDVTVDNLQMAVRAITAALERATRDGELSLTREPREVAHSLIAMAQALSQFGRARVPREMLRNIADGARAILA